MTGDWPQSLSFTVQACLIGLFVIAVSILAIYVAPSSEIGGPPDVVFESTTTNDTVTITHVRGDSVPRKTLSIRNESFDVIVADLGAATERRIREPFQEATVSQGDSIVLERDELPGERILIVWENEEGRNAVIRTFDY